MSIQIKNMKKSYNGSLLYQVSQLIIGRNSKVGIVGENGCGKTTLLQMIQGCVQPDEGKILLSENVFFISQLLQKNSFLSGGEQTKKKFQQAIYEEAGILLADEPTNHLDIEGIAYVVRELKKYKGTLLIVSHDRSFLNKICTHILEIAEHKIQLYEGNYDQYKEQKEVAFKEKKRLYEKQQDQKKYLTKAIQTTREKSEKIKKAPKRMGNSEARLHKRGKQQSAQKSLNKQILRMQTRLDKMNPIEKIANKKEIVLPFSAGKKINRPFVLETNEFSLSVASKKLFDKTNFTLKTGSKTQLVGSNGCGKTSLLREITKRKSQIAYVKNVKIGYFSQAFDLLDEKKTIFENLNPKLLYEKQVIYDLCAQLHFKGNTMSKTIGDLSGGERSKVAILQLLLSEANVLLLDEPTNHLDTESLEALEEALDRYEGTILFTSHDKYFAQKLATEVWRIENKKISNVSFTKMNSKHTVNQEQEKLVLENRKSELISELSFSKIKRETNQLEEEYEEVIRQLEKVKRELYL